MLPQFLGLVLVGDIDVELRAYGYLVDRNEKMASK